MAELSGMLLSEEDQETTLRREADLAVRSIPGGDAVGVTLLDEGVASTHAATSGLVYDVDRYQYEIAMARACKPWRTACPTGSRTWPCRIAGCAFVGTPPRGGFNSSLSLPLTVRGKPLGALNFYSGQAHSFGPPERETALMFAAQAAVALANSQTYAAGVRLAEQLREAWGPGP